MVSNLMDKKLEYWGHRLPQFLQAKYKYHALKKQMSAMQPLSFSAVMIYNCKTKEIAIKPAELYFHALFDRLFPNYMPLQMLRERLACMEKEESL